MDTLYVVRDVEWNDDMFVERNGDITLMREKWAVATTKQNQKIQKSR